MSFRSEAALVAADDVVFFHRSETVVSQRLGQAGGGVKRVQVPEAAHKDVDLVSELVGWGCRISNVRRWAWRTKVADLIPGNHRGVRQTLGQSGSQFYGGAGPVVLHLIAAVIRLLQSSLLACAC